MKEWFFSNIYDYWDQRKDSIYRYSSKLANLDREERSEALRVIEMAIEHHVKSASDELLVKYAFVMTDDLYRAANRTWNKFNQMLYSYLEASSGILCKLLSERGFTIHYLIDNTYKNSYQGMLKPLEIFRDWFQGSSFVYICPQEIAMEIVGSLGKDKFECFSLLPSGLKEARNIANILLEECNTERRHYVFLDTDWQPGSFAASMVSDKNPKVITIIRNQAPVPGSKCYVSCFDEKGNSLVEGL